MTFFFPKEPYGGESEGPLVAELAVRGGLDSLTCHMRFFHLQRLALTNTLINAKIGQQLGSARRTGNTWKKIAGGLARNVRVIFK